MITGRTAAVDRRISAAPCEQARPDAAMVRATVLAAGQPPDTG